MKRATGAFLAGLLLAFAGACDGSDVGLQDNPVPIVQSTEPAVVTRSASPVDVDVLGLGFVQGAEARWNGDVRATTYVDGTRLVVTLAPQDLLGTFGDIDVVNPAPGGGASAAAVTLAVGNPLPTLTSISPTQAPAAVTPQIVLQAQGSDFLVGPSGSTLRWNGAPLQTIVSSTTELSAVVPDYLLRLGHAAEITVRNPSPGGGSSNALSFTVQNPLPVVASTEPDGVPVRTVASLDVIGADFVHGATVWIDDTPIVATLVSATRLTVQVPATATEGSTGLAQVRVENPEPGGGSSNTVDLTVWLTPPRIDDLFPSHVFAGSPDFTLLISGAEFDPAATVLWNGDPRAATIVSTQRIEVVVSATDVSEEGTIEIGVVNPGSAGQASANLTVLPAASGGSALLAERGDHAEIVLMDVFGAEILTAHVSGGAYRVDAAPAGTAAVYHAGGHIFELDPHTGESRRLTTSVGPQFIDAQWPRYSANGDWVYFMAQSTVGSSRNWELWRAPTTAGAAEPVLASPSENYGYPSPSRRGDRVVYSVGVGGGSQLNVLDLTTGMSTPLGVEGATSRWTPADEWIVYWTWNRELRAVRPDGTQDRAITTDLELAAGFDVSPAGDQIVAAAESSTRPVLIDFASGAATEISSIGSVGSMAWYGP